MDFRQENDNFRQDLFHQYLFAMLKYNFDRIFKARGIEKPFTFLKRSGFGDHLAGRIKNNIATRLELREMERLCLLLRCTPNDLYEWVPDDSAQIDDRHPMNVIRKKEKIADLTKTLHSVPLEQVEEIEKLIREHIAGTQPPAAG